MFPPVGRGAQQIVAGMPMWRNPLPWKTTPLTPNIGKIDSTDDMRPGLGWGGLVNLENFVRQGGVLIVSSDDTSTSQHLRPDAGAVGAGADAPERARNGDAGEDRRRREPDRVRLRRGRVDLLGAGPGVRREQHPRRPGRAAGAARTPGPSRPTGRGTADDPDQPQGRPAAAPPPEEPKVEAWQAAPVTDEQLRNPLNVIPPQQRPRVVLRYGDASSLLVSGLLENGNEIAQRPAVVDVPLDKGHVVVFAHNPMWRGETQGTYGFVFNAILNFDQLNAGRKLTRSRDWDSGSGRDGGTGGRAADEHGRPATDYGPTLRRRRGGRRPGTRRSRS